jgi:hypothetical protein
MQERFDRLGSVRKVASEMLDQRLADATLLPDSFSIAGEYSETRSKSLDLLAARRAEVSLSEVVANYPVLDCGR